MWCIQLGNGTVQNPNGQKSVLYWQFLALTFQNEHLRRLQQSVEKIMDTSDLILFESRRSDCKVSCAFAVKMFQFIRYQFKAICRMADCYSKWN